MFKIYTLLFTLILFSTTIGFGQDPLTTKLPEKFDGLEQIIMVNHFPSPVYASTDEDRPNEYFWKHNTAIFSPFEAIEILEGGAYIYYNDQWNLRITYNAKQFSKLYRVPKGKMKAGEPYTFVKNWRAQDRIFGGWAMWYVIGKTKDGKTVFGIGKLDTKDQLYSETK